MRRVLQPQDEQGNWARNDPAFQTLCDCFVPMPRYVPVWRAVECWRCGRRILDEAERSELLCELEGTHTHSSVLRGSSDLLGASERRSNPDREPR